MYIQLYNHMGNNKDDFQTIKKKRAFLHQTQSALLTLKYFMPHIVSDLPLF